MRIVNFLLKEGAPREEGEERSDGADPNSFYTEEVGVCLMNIMFETIIAIS